MVMPRGGSFFLGFAAVFLALFFLHYPFLRLPYFWDETYYVLSALDFYHKGLLVAENVPPHGHPPLVLVYLGWMWKLLGFSPWVTRSAMLCLAAATTPPCWLIPGTASNSLKL